MEFSAVTNKNKEASYYFVITILYVNITSNGEDAIIFLLLFYTNTECSPKEH